MWYYRSNYTVNGVHEITFTKYSEPWWFARYQTKSTFENKVRLYQTMPAQPLSHPMRFLPLPPMLSLSRSTTPICGAGGWCAPMKTR
jgi:hypothetical protein